MSSYPSISEMFNLENRVAIVTGAAGNLGVALASALAQAGARVVATSRDRRRAEETAASLPKPHGAEHLGVELDQTDTASVDRCVDEVVEVTGRIDVLVNNANAAFAADWSTISGDEFTRQLANLTGHFLLARRCRDHALERRAPASIILLGSMYGLVGSYPDVYEGLGAGSPVAYHALKGGVVNLTRYLAVYWAKDNVRVNCLSPGPFPSPRANPQLVERLTSRVPLGRMGRPSELQGALLLLASDAGSYITGQNIVVDGGWTAW